MIKLKKVELEKYKSFLEKQTIENIDKKTIMGLINKIEVIDSETIKIYYKFSE